MSLDWELYRELFPLDDNPIWGRFPNPPLAKVGERLGVSRKTVWRKLNEWREGGFLCGYLILPHPDLLGVGLTGFSLRVNGPGEKQRLLADLDLVDGVLLSSYEVGPKVDVLAVADSEASQAHRKELISRLAGVTSIGPSRKVWLPRCDGALSPRDLRIIAALRSDPEDTLAGLAGRVGVSVRTATRRMSRLRQTRALLSHCLEDWSRFPGTVVGLQLEVKPGFDARVVARQLVQRRPECLEIPSHVSPRGASLGRPTYLALVPSGPSIESLTSAALSIPGVAKAEHFFPGGERGYAGWIDVWISRATGRGSS